MFGIRRRVLVGVCAVFSASVGSVQAEPVRLMHRFDVGQTFTVRTDHRARLEITKEEQLTTVDHQTDSVQSYLVESIDATGSATVVSRVDAVLMRASSNGEGTVEYDSTKLDAKPHEQFAAVQETVGKPLTRFVVSPFGTVDAVQPLLKGVVSSDASSQSHEHPFVRLPSEAVEPGATWDEKFKLVITIKGELPEAVNVKRKYQLDGLKDGIASISWRTVVLTPIRSTQLESELIQQTLDGMIEFDVAKGRIVLRKSGIDRQVVGFDGGGSKFRSVVDRTERLASKLTPAAGIQPVLLSVPAE